MVGNTGQQPALVVELKPGERIVGVKHKNVKPMYRYGLRFLIAKV